MSVASEKEIKNLLSKLYKTSQKHHQLMMDLNAVCERKYGVPFDADHLLNSFPKLGFEEFDSLMTKTSEQQEQ